MVKGEKVFVIDTNVLIHRPDAILSFRDNEVVIPLWVLEELDRLKTYRDERGRNARHAIRFLDNVGKHGNLNEGVKIDNGSILRVLSSHGPHKPKDILEDKPDNKIILTAHELHAAGKQVFFVSKDINARVKATALGLKSVDYEKQKVDFENLYSGYVELDASSDTISLLHEQERIACKEKFVPNQFIILKDRVNKTSSLTRYNINTGELFLIDSVTKSICGVKPLNDEQRMSLDLLLDDSVSLVTLVGKAGTGKTLIALASAFYNTLEKKKYSRVLVSRPIMPMGKDIGFLPGAKEEKLTHWMQPLFDNLEYILQAYRKPNVKNIDQLLNSNIMQLEALSYIRGRSLPNQFIIIDEAQNLSPHEIKTIVSRAGEGTKVVLTGDPYQIDSPYLDANSNGLTFLVEAFKGQHIFGHVTLEHTERSELAELAAELL